MKHLNKLVYSGLIVLISSLSSCLAPSSTTFSSENAWGTVEPDPKNSNLYIRDDRNGALLFHEKFQNFKPGNRAIISYEIEEENMQKTGGEEYYHPAAISKFEEIPLEDLKTFNNSVDTFKFDPIDHVTLYPVLAQTYQKKTAFGMEVSYMGTNDSHSLDLVYNTDIEWRDNDTIRFELRHNNRGDITGNRNYVRYKAYNLQRVFENKKMLVIKIDYNVLEKNEVTRKFVSFRWENQN